MPLKLNDFGDFLIGYSDIMTGTGMLSEFVFRYKIVLTIVYNYRMLKEAAGRTVDAWFTPKKFETREFYEKRGIRFVNQIIPTGRLFDKAVESRTRTRMGKHRTLKSLRTYELMSRLLETVHTAGNLPFIYLMAKYPESIPVGILLTTVVNLYPIALQRYKRVRFNQIMERLNARIAGKGEDMVASSA